MELTDGEKLIIFMLTEIYEKLDIKGELDASFVQKAVSSGNAWSIPWRIKCVQFDPSKEDPQVVKEVCDILEMWSFVENSYKELSDEDRDDVKKSIEPLSGHVFKGFDGNSQKGHMWIARFMIDDLGVFQQFKGRELNAHAPTLDTYLRMLPIFEDIQKKISGRLLNVVEISSILNAQKKRS